MADSPRRPGSAVLLDITAASPEATDAALEAMQKRQADMFAHNDNGFIEPLDDLLKKTGANRAAVDAYKDAITVEGKTIAFPWRGASYYTYYNKKIFEKAGIPTPDTFVKAGTWTWDKYYEIAKKLSSGDGSVFGSSVYFWGSN